TARTDPANARTATFQLLDGASLYGGFSGGETARSQRNLDPETNGCSLSGDIGTSGNSSDNAYHVVTGSGTTSSAVLDGFNITAGNANQGVPSGDIGGGMLVISGSPS